MFCRSSVTRIYKNKANIPQTISHYSKACLFPIVLTFYTFNACKQILSTIALQNSQLSGLTTTRSTLQLTNHPAVSFLVYNITHQLLK